MSDGQPEPGRLIVLSGPSGVGKTTVTERLCQTGPFQEAVSATTRKPRPREENGVHYHFLTSEEFRRGIGEGAFLENARVHGEMYGTLRSEVEAIRQRGRHCILTIDVQGAMQLKEAGIDASYVFLTTPDFATLKRRLEARRTEDSASLDSRLQTAERELTMQSEYDLIVVNDEVDNAVSRIREAVGETPLDGVG